MRKDKTMHTSLMEITARPATVFVKGSGAWLYDSDGKAYLDFIQGWAVNCLGHSPDPLVAAITEQAGKLINPSPAFYNQPMLDLAAALTAGAGLERIFFANSGAEANEGAIKLARKWGSLHRDGAYEIITMAQGFHGRTLATMAASGKDGWDQLFEPKVPGFPKVPFSDLAAVEAAINGNTAAVMLEPVQGEAGVIDGSDDYLLGLRALTEAHGILLIADEIQTGMGRTGKMFACAHTGITPDIMTLGKGLGGGVPLAALLAREDVCCFEHGDQGGTFNGNPLMTAAGLAVWKELSKPGFLEDVVTAGEHLTKGLETFSANHGFGAVRGRGLLRALDLKEAIAGDIAARAMEAGLLLNAPRPDSLRFMPALNVSHEEIGQMLGILDRVVD
ncbi:MAG: acetylornithine transaminase [Rhodospirillaceae bacterium]|nr:acetylornithine transaminase [Rhodospirillaceae bacterium]MBT5195532.1 acetylornithine transaminase [Rhodospirillaceae bacterium]MBT5896010.1 acetylornithine transaminase [Rhodospirillaceae bacterium]MBT6430833.1 acetylornithine transaminase [Rhodospirillaceae bacterium]MBT7756907.1 acetylornithine transaminase [Rhodospirillaceae bacterium]